MICDESHRVLCIICDDNQRSFIRRIDAQADYLVAHGRNDTFTADWAFQYMTDETMLTGMGEWSDGTPVLPLIWHTNAINEVSAFSDCT